MHVHIDTRSAPVRPRGFGCWTLNGPRGQQVVYTGWWAEAPAYLAQTYGTGHWFLAA
jgi:hypothetical protein